MTKKRVITIASFIIAAIGGLSTYYYVQKQSTKTPIATQSSIIVPVKEKIPEVVPETDEAQLERGITGKRSFPLSAKALVTAQEVQPECDANLMEISYSLIQIAGQKYPNYNGQWAFSPDWMPSNAPCWKDFYFGAHCVQGIDTINGGCLNSQIQYDSSMTPFIPADGVDSNVVVTRLYFVMPTPSPTPTPIPTATPTPTPSPTPKPLPICAWNQYVGNPPSCKCLGVIFKNGRCR